MRSIESIIVGFEVSKDEQVANPSIISMNESIERTDVLLGSTYKIKPPTSDHAIYVTINDVILNKGTDFEQRQPFEIFINSKNMEHYQWVVALTLLISAVFRKGGDITFIVDELGAVFDPQGGYFKRGGRFMPSLVAEIAEVIQQHLKIIGIIKDEALSDAQKELIEEKRNQFKKNESEDSNVDGEFPESATLCKDCNIKAVVKMDGCSTCLNCSSSSCQ